MHASLWEWEIEQILWVDCELVGMGMGLIGLGVDWIERKSLKRDNWNWGGSLGANTEVHYSVSILESMKIIPNKYSQKGEICSLNWTSLLARQGF